MTLMIWSRPALILARKRYPLMQEQQQQQQSGSQFNVDCSIRLMARILTPPVDRLARRSWITDTLFDWKTWMVAAESQLAYRLLEAAIRYSASNWIDSQLWLLADNLDWITTRADRQGLAPQLAAALKPFAGNPKLKITNQNCNFKS